MTASVSTTGLVDAPLSVPAIDMLAGGSVSGLMSESMSGLMSESVRVSAGELRGVSDNMACVYARLVDAACAAVHDVGYTAECIVERNVEHVALVSPPACCA
jgi:hypothetical protein